MKQALKKYFGYDTFRPSQEEIIRRVLRGEDCVVLMPTGGGKSLCFQLPAILSEGTALVVSPLISLMKDQVDALRANGVSAEYLNSSLPPAERDRVLRLVRDGEVKILYVAPERFAVSGFENFLRTLRISLIAIDEAHCISEWGHDFRPDYRNLNRLRQKFPGVPMIALTATATENVRKDIVRQLGLDDSQVFLSSFNRPNLSYVVVPKKDSIKIVHALLAKHKGESAIIYCFSRGDTEKLAGQLKEKGYRAAAYHAGLTARERQDNQDAFIRDEIDIIVATIAFGMGIDKPDVRLVIHYSLPKSVEGYYQETGRAGRDGLPAECVLLFTYADTYKHDFFIRKIDDAAEQNKAREKLDDVVRYGNLEICRRGFLLRYFNEQYAEDDCESCDVCVPSLRVGAIASGGTEEEAGDPSRRTRKRTSRAGASLLPLSFDQGLFELLRTIRTKEAAALGVPPYVVFGDKTLREMAAYFPKDQSALLSINGVGDRKCAQFGEKFLAAIRWYSDQHHIEEHARPDGNVPGKRLAAHLSHETKQEKGMTYDATKRLILEQIPLQEIAARRDLAPGTILAHIEKLVAADPLLPIAYLRPAVDRFDRIVAAFAESKGFALTPVRQILGEAYSYEELRLARMFIANPE